MNPFLNYAVPPYDAVMPATPQLVMSIVFGSWALGMWIYAAVLFQRQRDVMPLMAMFGGALCVFAEVIVDILGNCWFPVHGQQTAISYFGHSIPMFDWYCYMFYYGGLTFITVRQFQAGVSAAQLWKWFVIVALIDCAFEPIPIQFGTWIYYGEQPFNFFGFPLWWAPVNSVGAFVAAALIYKLRPYLSGITTLAIIPLVIAGDLMGNVATSWPLYVTLHSGQGLAVNTVAGFLVLFLCWLTMRIIISMVAKPAVAQAAQSENRSARLA